MARRKIIILGGGMAGLSAAYQLTKTPALRERNAVTLYQLGWRLGGKGASGRDRYDRSLEHGLHIWFGCYDNTFRMMRDIYTERGGPYAWTDMVKPQNFTPLGVKDDAGAWSYWPLTWATNDAVPGDGRLTPSLWNILEEVANWIILWLEGREGAAPMESPSALAPPTARGALSAAAEFLRRFAGAAAAPARAELDQVVQLIGQARDAHRDAVAAGARADAAAGILGDVLNIFAATTKGIFEDLILTNKPLISLDHLEFRQWLLTHGADPAIVANSTVVRTLYDAAFQYTDGDALRPDMAAGTALGVALRLMSYMGSMAWEVQAGMGEVMVGPLYDQLRKNGVTFKFFHKVTGVEPDAAPGAGARPAVATVRLALQAETITGEYRPVVDRDGLTVWPSEPDWSQLKDGAAMAAAGVNFESHWCDWPAAGGPIVLRRGEDFDTVVLAISLGAFKPLNDEDPNICQGLIDRSPAFADWVANVGIVATSGVQLWCDRPARGLGWPEPKAAIVSGPEYLNIWADMSQVLAFESWPDPATMSLHYLTGTYATTLHRRPASDTGTPALAREEIREQTIAWLNTRSSYIWKAARADGHFDWSVLAAPAGMTGKAGFDAQYWRANIDPTECTTQSAAGTTRYRLHADESGFTNLILAGEGAATGTCSSFEGAVMSGMAASRAICGEPQIIVGYDFLERRPY